MKVTAIVVGLILCLGGSLITVALPIRAMLTDASKWGGCPPDRIDFYDRKIRRDATIARVLFVVGTALQIYGSLGAI